MSEGCESVEMVGTWKVSRDGASGGLRQLSHRLKAFTLIFSKEKLKAFLKIESDVIRFDFWKILLERTESTGSTLETEQETNNFIK